MDSAYVVQLAGWLFGSIRSQAKYPAIVVSLQSTARQTDIRTEESTCIASSLI